MEGGGPVRITTCILNGGRTMGLSHIMENIDELSKELEKEVEPTGEVEVLISSLKRRVKDLDIRLEKFEDDLKFSREDAEESAKEYEMDEKGELNHLIGYLNSRCEMTADNIESIRLDDEGE
jgi:septal ring factor EnvC (AmiA/AmiB activator)